MTGNARIMEEMGYFNLDGFTPMEIGRLDKNTGMAVRYNGLIRSNWEIYAGKCEGIIGKQHAEGRAYPYRLIMESGGYLEIPKIVYRALTYPEISA